MVAIVVDEPNRLRIAEGLARLNRKLLPQVMAWLSSGRLAPGAMVTQTFAARDARDAFDLIARHPERTVKVHLDFAR